jgi:ferredoxin
MRVRLDTELCQGHGRCYTLAPDLFDSDELGHCVLRVEDVPAGLEAEARNGVDNCPEHALSLED